MVGVEVVVGVVVGVEVVVGVGVGVGVGVEVGVGVGVEVGVEVAVVVVVVVAVAVVVVVVVAVAVVVVVVVTAAPFLKWAGGKTQLFAELIPRIVPRPPAKIRTYYEPFIGGGAVLFALANEHRFERAVIADNNSALVDTYIAVRDMAPALTAILRTMADDYAERGADYYYEVRAEREIDGLSARSTALFRAARLIFLNRTCYNGLYRVNRKGQFNVPHGRYENPRICDADGLRAASHALANVEIRHGDFATTISDAKERDAIYFDPPYYPVSRTASFVSYGADGFDASDQCRLAWTFADCARRGVRVVLSNSDTPFVRTLYRSFQMTPVQASRALNSVGTKRGKINELIITGG